MNSCSHCGGDVPKRSRLNAYGKKAKKDAKVFYHYACVTWRKL